MPPEQFRSNLRDRVVFLDMEDLHLVDPLFFESQIQRFLSHADITGPCALASILIVLCQQRYSIHITSKPSIAAKLHI